MENMESMEKQKVTLHNTLLLQQLGNLPYFEGILSEYDSQFVESCREQDYRMTLKQINYLESMLKRYEVFIYNDNAMRPYLWMLYAAEGVVSKSELRALTSCITNKNKETGKSYRLSKNFLLWMADAKERILEGRPLMSVGKNFKQKERQIATDITNFTQEQNG